MEIPGVMNCSFDKNIANIYLANSTRGIELDMKEPVAIKQNNVMVPVRAMAELLGLKVEWDGKNKTVKLSRPEKKTNL
ncbi:MAG: copper amine oxidase N-terminal domain-containing protein [Firmicutes bacterium]|nr:copper amine oxidase N-terminal domain-containing protein [Bacillota bacterium]